MHDLFRKTEQYIRKESLLDLNAGFRVVAGVSGGADSVCLLLVLNDLKARYGGCLEAVHVNHHIRGKDADEDQAFVEQLCRSLDIRLTVFPEDVPGFARENGFTLEEAGRLIRYRRLTQTALACSAKVAVAHHLDDNAETILFHMIRGAGLKGLAGMQPVSRFEDCEIIRPLLSVTRDEIEAFLADRAQPFCTDLTNVDQTYTRNRIRHSILKEMKSLNPEAAAHICRAGQAAGRAEAFIGKLAEKLLFAETERTDGEISFPAELLVREDPVVAEKFLYQALFMIAGNTKDFSSTHVADLIRLGRNQTGKKVMLPHGVRAIKKEDRIVLRKQAAPAPVLQPYDIKIGEALLKGGSLMLPSGEQVFFELFDVSENAEKRNALIEKKKYTKAFDYDTITGSLFMGTRRPGDKIPIRGGTKSVKRFLIDNKIPEENRMYIPLLRDEETVLWIVGFRISEKHKITDQTKTVLKVEVLAPEKKTGANIRGADI